MIHGILVAVSNRAILIRDAEITAQYWRTLSPDYSMDNATDCTTTSSLFETAELEELNDLNSRVISEKARHSFSLSFKRRLTIASCCVKRCFWRTERILRTKISK